MLRGLPREQEGRGSRVQLREGDGGGGGGAQPARQTLSTSSLEQFPLPPSNTLMTRGPAWPEHGNKPGEARHPEL